jgi:16S rRNA pseudouridine516 synthase
LTKIPTSRLDRLLANLGYGSRKEVQSLVAAGLVTLDGGVVAKADGHVAVTADLAQRMLVDGLPLDPPPPLTLLMHKPLGVVCSHREPGRSVYDLLPPRWSRRDPAISTVGRLDKETSGLLLLTDDGGLLHRIISPKALITKRYLVSLENPLRGDEAELFASGNMLIEGETRPLLPAILDKIASNRCWLTISEGRYHQVRRMFTATGNHVVALHRDRIGGLDLPETVEAGAFRVLTDGELGLVMAMGKFGGTAPASGAWNAGRQ